MSPIKRITVLLGSALVLSLATAGAVQAVDAPTAVVGAVEIQSRLDDRADQADADRSEIRRLLQRTDVQRIAAAAGLDLERAGAAASVLSGDALAQAAAQARAVPVDLAGSGDSIVMPVTTVIIVLLLLILLVG
ncbi:MAG: hypothetical protein IPJ24_07820 [bacterium]|nr:hypothetical protein [bacterium]